MARWSRSKPKFRKSMRSRRKRRTKRRIPRALLGGIPQSKTVKLRYTHMLSLNSGTGTEARQVYRANSVYDPDSTGIGSQPNYFDVWAGLYNHYVVKGSKINVRVCGTSSTAGGRASYAAINLNDDTTLTVTREALLEQKDTNWRIAKEPLAGGSTTVTKSFSAKKFFGIKDILDNKSTMGATVAANPTEQAFYHVVLGSIDSTDDASQYDVVVTIDYIVQFWEIKEQAQS